MITILVDEFHPRTGYCLELVFDTLLSTTWRSIRADAFDGENLSGAIINYSSRALPGIATVPVSGLLYENGVREEFIPAVRRPSDTSAFRFPALFPSESTNEDFLVDFDLFSAIFYLATEYPHYSHKLRDDHDRHDEWALFPLFNLWMNDEPLCHHYAEFLWEQLISRFEGLVRKERHFDYEVTIDVDRPWKYKNKGLFLNLGGLARDMLTLNFSQAGERIQTLARGKDPFDVFEEIKDLCPRERLHFFFLINRHSPHDSRFTYKNNAYRKLIFKVARDWKMKAGLHPSYESYLDEEKIEFEVKALRVLIPEFNSSRQHYLRYRLPETFRMLEKQGVRHEYSICPVKYAGFKTGICTSYLWYDLEEDRKSELMLHPSMVMDRSLMQYLRLDPLIATKEIQTVVEKVKQVRGKFIVILHNETFSESGEWKGWKPVLIHMLEMLKKETLHGG